MRYFMIAMGTIITLLFLLAILAGITRASTAASAVENTEPADGTPLVYLTIAGGTALLAGGVWLGTLRRVQEVCQLTTRENYKPNSG